MLEKTFYEVSDFFPAVQLIVNGRLNQNWTKQDLEPRIFFH